MRIFLLLEADLRGNLKNLFKCKYLKITEILTRLRKFTVAKSTMDVGSCFNVASISKTELEFSNLSVLTGQFWAGWLRRASCVCELLSCSVRQGNKPKMCWKVSWKVEIQTDEHSVRSLPRLVWHYPGFNLDWRRTTEYLMAMVHAFIRGRITSSEMRETRTEVMVK